MSRDEQAAAQTQGTGVGPEPHTLGTRGLTAGAEHVKSAATGKGVVLFEEYGTHKTIGAVHGPVSGTIRVSDQATIDYLREAFEKAGWEVEDRVH